MSQEALTPKRRFSVGLLVFMLIPLFGLVVAVLMLVAEGEGSASSGAGGTLPPPIPGIMNGPAPDFSVQTLDGQTVRLADYRGRVVFLNFWATWCPPCVEELPALERFAQAQAQLDGGAVVLASNNTESPEQISAFLNENNITLDGVRVLLDTDNRVYQQYGIVRLPTTWVIDREGVLRAVKFGEFDDATLQAYLTEVGGS